MDYICNLHTFDFSKDWFRLCVEFTVKPDKVDAFHEEFSKCVAISVKEAGCKQVRPSNMNWNRFRHFKRNLKWHIKKSFLVSNVQRFQKSNDSLAFRRMGFCCWFEGSYACSGKLSFYWPSFYSSPCVESILWVINYGPHIIWSP